MREPQVHRVPPTIAGICLPIPAALVADSKSVRYNFQSRHLLTPAIRNFRLPPLLNSSGINPLRVTFWREWFK
jgi:hypothetical protein